MEEVAQWVLLDVCSLNLLYCMYHEVADRNKAYVTPSILHA